MCNIPAAEHFPKHASLYSLINICGRALSAEHVTPTETAEDARGDTESDWTACLGD